MYVLLFVIFGFVIKFQNSKISIWFIVTVKVVCLRNLLIFPIAFIFFIFLVLLSFVLVLVFIFTQYYYWSLIGFWTGLSTLLTVWFKEWCIVVDVSVAPMYVSILIIQVIHDGVIFCCFHISGWLLGTLPGTLHFNLAVDAGSLVGFIIKLFRCIFGHGGGVFVILKLYCM